jgi:hypothetical protein
MLHCVALVRTNIAKEHWFLQEPHGITSQKMAFFSHRHENLKSYMFTCCFMNTPDKTKQNTYIIFLMKRNYVNHFNFMKIA